jgi:hypothetical protein
MWTGVVVTDVSTGCGSDRGQPVTTAPHDSDATRKPKRDLRTLAAVDVQPGSSTRSRDVTIDAARDGTEGRQMLERTAGAHADAIGRARARTGHLTGATKSAVAGQYCRPLKSPAAGGN